MASVSARRRAGLLVPLFSCPTSTSWGIGDIGDLSMLIRWLVGAGQRVLQLLPINEMAPGQQSPYSAISAMAIDPLFICVGAVPDFVALGGEATLSEDDRALLDEVRSAPRIRYAAVRRLKGKALRAAFNRFEDAEWSRDSDRARALKRFLSEQAWWIEDYAVFRALRASEDERPWPEWPEAFQRRDPPAINRLRHQLSHEILFYQYLQWVAHGQWNEARAYAKTHGVQLFGDLPFMVDGDSADVWAHQHQFRLDASVGAPPDAFSATGQDWGMPVYRWDVIAREQFLWLRERARRAADLYDGCRVDHVVGFYRTYARPRDGQRPFFTPGAEAEQEALGERVLTIFREAGSELIAEDLGIVPDFVRASLARLGVPGFCVFRWERHWHVEGHPFRDPSEYPPLSVAATGTHDTEPLVTWWEGAAPDERGGVSLLPIVQRLTNGTGLAAAPIGVVRDVILEALFASASSLVLVPIQDVFGWSDRINEPSTVNDDNWTFRLPWPLDRMPDEAVARERRATLRAWSERYGR